ncbi:Stk1 family PASTA domain-containing Ser/Thr kinase [Arenivirga flava]|uniref:non-specific serine/threonine protein kinase n=1 Tax=Arenivirga flava TaxID=1930060 RepID=A0AA37UM34_9MICO|nr:Stk1 family PASTA domain-containing Ser/Thr kinase [Arenivirga flava]GMA29052.1 putative serine/threonine-protein kinase [Arenivirga flava]
MTDGIPLLAGRYEVGELVGRGGMADVYKGRDARLGRTVAIKLLKPSLATDPTFRARFRKEAQAAARMAHPTIVRVFDAGEDTIEEDGAERQQPFIIMEFIDGTVLRDLLEEGPLEPDEAARIAGSVLTALEYSHRAGVVHRDIKPGNIMLARNGQVKVMDFGIARAVSDTASTVAQTTAVLGTANYFSPEQARNEGVDARTDLYSTGVVLFEMLTGRTPFRGDSAVAVAYQHVSEQAVAPSSLNPAVSPVLDSVVDAALAKDRAERFQSASDFRTQLQQAAAGKMPVLPKRGEQDGMFSAAEREDSDETLRRLQAGSESGPRTQSRPPAAWIWSGILGVAFVLVAVVIWVVNLGPVAIGGDLSVSVPDVVGLSEEDARAQIEDDQLGVEVFEEYNAEVPAGDVISSTPIAGRNVPQDYLVRITVSMGVQQVEVPELEGRSEESARSALDALGLAVGETSQQNSATVPAGQVISTDPIPGTSLASGSSIDLLLSSGLVTVPNVVGQTVANAAAQLRSDELQLSVRPIADPSCGGSLVTQQSLTPGDHPQRSTIEITYCTG